MPNANGLMSGKLVTYTGEDDSNAYVRRTGANGDVIIDGDLYASTIISIPDISLNPLYIKNPKNLGVNPITESAVVIEGGADRIDISDQAVALTLYKPFSSQTIGYQQIGALQFAGVNTDDTIVRYGSIRGVSLNATSGATKGMLEFQVLDGLTHSTRMEIDASANVIRTDGGSRFRDRGYNLYAGAVKITTAGSITKQTSATLVPESAFTIPTGLDGYYSFTAQVTLGGVGTVADGENFQLYLDVSGGSLTPINGTINIIDMTENSANTFSQTPGGIIMQRLTEGEVIQLYHLEQGSYTFSSGSIQVAYTYLGDTAL
jgi:hypothetical protein